MTTQIARIRNGRMQRRKRWILVTALLTLLALILCFLMLMLGNTIYPVQDVFKALLGEKVQGVSFAVNKIRLPRMVAGVFAGFAFGVGGYIFQSILRNPLANPNVLGITSGSSAAAVFCITILHANNAFVSIASIIAGLATVLTMYFLAKGKTFSIGRLILIGIGIQAMLDAVISYLMLKSSQNDIGTVLRWLSGSLNGLQLSDAPPLILAVIILTPLAMAFSKHLTILALGEETASALGVSPNKSRMILIVIAVLLVAFATATTGPIAFIAFLAGPIANRLVGIGRSNIIPAGLIGLNIVLIADLIGQFAFSYRYPVGVITGLIGAPYLLYLLIKMNRKGEL